jgi:hypothetical protein
MRSCRMILCLAAAENLGTRAANELFGLLTTIDYSALPHPPEGWGECYPTLELRPCGGGCETIHLDYAQARDLLPGFWTVYDWMDQMLCRTAALRIAPRDLLRVLRLGAPEGAPYMWMLRMKSLARLVTCRISGSSSVVLTSVMATSTTPSMALSSP